MMKKTVSALLALLMLAVCAGCSESSSTPKIKVGSDTVCLGDFDGLYYTNNFSGVIFSVPVGWTAESYTDTTSSAAVSTVPYDQRDSFTDYSFYLDSEDENTSAAAVGITFSFTRSVKSSAEYMEKLHNDKALQEDYYEQYKEFSVRRDLVETVYGDVYDVTLGGQEYKALAYTEVHHTRRGMTEAKYLELARQYNDYMVIIIITSGGISVTDADAPFTIPDYTEFLENFS